MPEYLKFSTTNVDFADQYGNVWIANDKGNREYGPSENPPPGTGFFLNIDPPEGGYTYGVYRNSVNYPYFYQMDNESSLVSKYNKLNGTSHTTSTQVINEIDGDNNAILFGQIGRDSMEFFLDAANTDSYPGNGNTWSDLSTNNADATMVNSPSYSNGVITFDGSNDYLDWASNFSVAPSNGFTFWVLWELPAQSSTDWNYFLLHNPSGSHKYEFGQFGQSANFFQFKDNISYAGTNRGTSMNSGQFTCFAFGTTSDGYSFSSVNGAAKGITNPGSNSFWGSSPTTNMVFDQLFRGASGGGFSYIDARVKMIAFYDKELSNAELEYNFRFGAAHRL